MTQFASVVRCAGRKGSAGYTISCGCVVSSWPKLQNGDTRRSAIVYARILSGSATMARRWYTYETRDSYLSEGVNDAWWVHHTSVGRETSVDSPYLIANEWVCANIG